MTIVHEFKNLLIIGLLENESKDHNILKFYSLKYPNAALKYNIIHLGLTNGVHCIEISNS